MTLLQAAAVDYCTDLRLSNESGGPLCVRVARNFVFLYKLYQG